MLCDDLKIQTNHLHQQLNNLPLIKQLENATLTHELLSSWLRALAVVQVALETHLNQSLSPYLKTLWQPQMQKFGLLMQDLRTEPLHSALTIAPAIQAAQALAAKIRLRGLEQPDSLIGSLYVLEGSTLGGQIIRQMVLRSPGLANHELYYFSAYSEDTQTHWQNFKQQINDLPLTEPEQRQIFLAACEMFEGFKNILSALYPYQAGDLKYLVVSINPEAGNHSWPDNPAIIHAALLASEQCWQAYPYLQQRYGERGKRYSDSDSGWLCTLVKLETDIVKQQIFWLAQVLAARGLPSFILGDHLLYIVKALQNASEASDKHLDKLLNPATELKQGFAAYQTNLLQTFSKRYWQENTDFQTFKLTELISGAFFDESCGRSNALQSLSTWLLREDGFSPETVLLIQRFIADCQAQQRGI